MKHRNIVIALGIMIVALRFLGFPIHWDNALYTLLGLLVIAFAYVGRIK